MSKSVDSESQSFQLGAQPALRILTHPISEFSDDWSIPIKITKQLIKSAVALDTIIKSLDTIITLITRPPTLAATKSIITNSIGSLPKPA